MLHASKIGLKLSRAGFQSSLGGIRSGFRCQQLTRRCVTVNAIYYPTDELEAIALAEYAKALGALGFRVQFTIDGGTLFVEAG